MDLGPLTVKIYAEEDTLPDFAEFIPVLHRWIQQRKVDDLLIDVADYTHVPGGPGLMLIAHEANYGLEFGSEDRFGLQYTVRQTAAGSNAEILASSISKALKAANLLQDEKSLQGKLSFLPKELKIIANRRRQNPNEHSTFDALKADLQIVLDQLYDAGNHVVEFQQADPRERFTVNVHARGDVTLPELLRRIQDRN